MRGRAPELDPKRLPPGGLYPRTRPNPRCFSPDSAVDPLFGRPCGNPRNDYEWRPRAFIDGALSVPSMFHVATAPAAHLDVPDERVQVPLALQHTLEGVELQLALLALRRAQPDAHPSGCGMRNTSANVLELWCAKIHEDRSSHYAAPEGLPELVV